MTKLSLILCKIKFKKANNLNIIFYLYLSFDFIHFSFIILYIYKTISKLYRMYCKLVSYINWF